MSRKRSVVSERKPRTQSLKKSKSKKQHSLLESNIEPIALFPFLTLDETISLSSTNKRMHKHEHSRKSVKAGNTKRAVKGGLACFTEYSKLDEANYGLQTYCRNNARTALVQTLLMLFGQLYVESTREPLRLLKMTISSNQDSPKTEMTITRPIIRGERSPWYLKRPVGNPDDMVIEVNNEQHRTIVLHSPDALQITNVILDSETFIAMLSSVITIRLDFAKGAVIGTESLVICSGTYFKIKIASMHPAVRMVTLEFHPIPRQDDAAAQVTVHTNTNEVD